MSRRALSCNSRACSRSVLWLRGFTWAMPAAASGRHWRGHQPMLPRLHIEPRTPRIALLRYRLSQ